jgi:hypothetical protein
MAGNRYVVAKTSTLSSGACEGRRGRSAASVCVTTIVTARFGGVVVSATLPTPLNRDAFGIGGVTLNFFCAICILRNPAEQLAFGSSSAELQED